MTNLNSIEKLIIVDKIKDLKLQVFHVLLGERFENKIENNILKFYLDSTLMEQLHNEIYTYDFYPDNNEENISAYIEFKFYFNIDSAIDLIRELNPLLKIEVLNLYRPKIQISLNIEKLKLGLDFI